MFMRRYVRIALIFHPENSRKITLNVDLVCGSSTGRKKRTATDRDAVSSAGTLVMAGHVECAARGCRRYDRVRYDEVAVRWLRTLYEQCEQLMGQTVRSMCGLRFLVRMDAASGWVCPRVVSVSATCRCDGVSWTRPRHGAHCRLTRRETPGRCGLRPKKGRKRPCKNLNTKH